MSDNPNEPSENASSSGYRVSKFNKHDKLVVLATFDHATDAHLLRAQLEDNGISATVSNEQSAQVIGASLFGRIAAVWVEVLILESDSKAGLEIKNQFLAQQPSTDIPEWQCQCGETVDAGFAQCWACFEPFNEIQ